MNRRIVAVAVLATTVLAACGASAPPARELANEMIDTLDVSDSVKECMHDAVDEFTFTAEEAAGFEDLDDVATKAADGNEFARQVMARFEASLGVCN